MRIFITGVSSGIGRELVKKLVNQGHIVFGIARRRELLKSLYLDISDNKKLIIEDLDFSKDHSQRKLLRQFQRLKFNPEVVIFNAGIYKEDLNPELDIKATEEILNINFLSIIRFIEMLLPISKKGTQFIGISSTSALKGSGSEGVGYGASKAALSNAFESLHLKYKHKFSFKLVYLGPIETSMVRRKRIFMKSADKAADRIIKVINEDRYRIEYPSFIFFGLKILKLLPEKIYFWILFKAA